MCAGVLVLLASFPSPALPSPALPPCPPLLRSPSMPHSFSRRRGHAGVVSPSETGALLGPDDEDMHSPLTMKTPSWLHLLSNKARDEVLEGIRSVRWLPPMV